MTPTDISILMAWGLTLYGVGLWVWSWTRVKDPIIRIRYYDSGVVIVFASTLALYALRDKELNFVDWILVFLGPLFISSAVWRLIRTQSYIKS